MNHARTYPTREAAERSKRFIAGGLRAAWHEPCGGFHLEPAAPPKLTPRKPPAGTGPDRATRALVATRDGHACVRCGRSVAGIRASVHHRLRRSHGTDNSLPNLILLCGSGTTGCHGYVHSHRCEDEGYTVRSGRDPRLVGVMYFEPPGSGMTRWLEDDGGVLCEPPAGAEVTV